MIIDAQVHLWEENSPARPWPEGAKPDIEPAMTAERFNALMDVAGVARAVIAPPAVSGFDTSYALEVAGRYPERYAITSRYNLDDPNWRDRLPGVLDQPGVLGIRLGILPAARQRWDESGDLADFWAACERLAIPLMVFAPQDLSAIAIAAGRHPGLTLVVDHVNLVGSTPETVGERVDALNTLAPMRNVAVKLGSLPLRSAGRYPYADLHEPLRRVLDAYGPDRLMWASDQTTTIRADKGSYQDNLNLMTAAYDDLPQADLDQILGGTVSRLFRWPM